jgi:hypothetical protein
MLLLLLTSNGHAKTVRAEAFELVDKHGHVVARFEPENEGAELLLMTGGKLGARVTTAPGFPAIELYGADGKPRVVAQVAAGGGAHVSLYDDKAHRFHLSVSSATPPLMTFSAKDGGQIAFGFAQDGGGRISVLDASGRPKVTVGGPDQTRMITVFGSKDDAEGHAEILWRAPGGSRPPLR